MYDNVILFRGRRRTPLDRAVEAYERRFLHRVPNGVLLFSVDDWKIIRTIRHALAVGQPVELWRHVSLVDGGTSDQGLVGTLRASEGSVPEPATEAEWVEREIRILTADLARRRALRGCLVQRWASTHGEG
jgi:hypothetical protein